MRRLVMVGAAAVALAGCGGGDGDSGTSTTPSDDRLLDTAKVERSITDSIKEQRDLNAKVVCPSDIIQEKGVSFACLATYEGGETTFTVDQVDDDGNVEYEGQ